MLESVQLISGQASVELANDIVSLTFYNGAGWQLTSLKHVPSGYECIAPGAAPAPLWHLQALIEDYKSNVDRMWEKNIQQELVEIDSTAPCCCAFTSRQEADTVILTLQWLGISVAQEPEALDITVDIALSPASPYAEWRLDVKTHSYRVGIQRVDFPLIGPLAASPATQLLVPNGWGQLIPDPSQSQGYHGHFPCGTCDLQATNLCDADQGVYLAAHDPFGNDKEIIFTPDADAQALTYRLVNHPAGLGTVGLGQDYVMPYAAAVGVFEGDWLAGAKLYRDWLPNAVWWPRQSLAQRSETPEWLKQTAFWIQAGGTAEQVVPPARALAAYLDVPVALHWYSWHEIPFDDHYPEYFPPKPGFAEGVRALQEAGIKVMPYINGRLWDPRSDSWHAEKAAYACAKDAQGIKYAEVYASHVALAVMCPTTSLWQAKIASTVERLVSEYGVNAVYIDQISAAPPMLCYDAGHPHAPGGGDFWVRGYRELLSEARARAKAADAEAMLTTEDAAEPFADKLDAFLMCNSTRDQLVPYYPAVYSGRSLTFGRYIFKEDFASPSAFATKLGQMFVFGAQLGWLYPSIMEPQYAQQAQYLKTLAQIRHAAVPYLSLGELVGFPTFTPQPACIETHWHMMNYAHDFRIEPLIPIQMPQAQGSIWRAEDGSLGMVMTNMGAKPCQVTWGLGSTAAACGMRGRAKVTRLENMKTTDEGQVNLEGFSTTAELLPYSARLYAITPP